MTDARNARHSVRVAFAEPNPPTWYRNTRSSVRVAFQGATVTARVGGAHLRVLGLGDGGQLLVGYVDGRVLLRVSGGQLLTGGVLARALSQPQTGGRLLADSIKLQVLRPFTPPYAKFWDGDEYVAGPVRVWDGTVFVNALAVRVWNGTAWVDAI